MKSARSCSGSLVLVFVGLLASSGCNSSHNKLGLVSGVVRLDDVPVSGAFVVFTPKQGRTSTAETDVDGRYDLSYTSRERGALIGEHSVSIESPAGLDADQVTEGSRQRRVTIPAKYNSRTTLTAEVQAGSNTIDFDLDAGK